MEDGVELWWKTTSVCVVCMLVDNKPNYYTEAAVVRENKGGGRVWLVSFCVRHGKHETLLSSNAEFLKRVIGHRLISEQNQPLLDLEELHTLSQKRERPKFMSPPFVVDLFLFSNGQFLDDQSIEEDIKARMEHPVKIPPSSSSSPAFPSSRLSSSSSSSSSSSPSSPSSSSSSPSSSSSATSPLSSSSPLFFRSLFANKQNPPKEKSPPPTKMHKVVFKISSKGTIDMQQFSSKIIKAVSIAPQHIFLLEASVERLYHIAEDRDSCLKKRQVYPLIKYFLVKGNENDFLNEMVTLLKSLKRYKGLQVVVSIGVEPPFPDFSKVFEIFKRETKIIRSVIVSIERSSKKLLKSLVLSPSSNHTPIRQPSDFNLIKPVTLNPAPPPRKMPKGKKGNLTKKKGPPQEDQGGKEKNREQGGETKLDVLPERSLDLFSIVKSLCEGSGGSICEEDFLPGSVLRVAEPLLEMLGAGSYAFDPHDFCGVVVPLLNTPDSSFVPFSRHFDCLRFFQKIQPLLPELRPDNLGFFSALKLKSIANECGMPDVVLSFLTERKNGRKARDVFETSQLLVVHNNMDIGAVDMERRCRCVVRAAGPGGREVAGCTGCI